MKHPYAAISAALAGTVLFVSATMVQASLNQVATPVGSNITTKADRLERPAPIKGDLRPISGTFAPVMQVMLYQTSPHTSTALPLPSIALAY
jgi:hypothetical protein